LLFIYTKRAAGVHLTCAGFGRNALLAVVRFIKIIKHATDIRIFEILRFSLLFLIIIIINKKMMEWRAAFCRKIWPGVLKEWHLFCLLDTCAQQMGFASCNTQPPENDKLQS
jgi:hypothetical protein